MKVFVVPLLAALAVIGVGCAANRPQQTSVPPPPPEPPLSEIPAYPELQKSYDVSAKLCVYPTLWIAKPIADGLVNAGYRVLPLIPPLADVKVENPDFIVEPLSFKHTTELRNGELWLFTRITLQVRRPLRVVAAETQIGPQAQPRIFQVYAKRSLGNVSTASESEYRANVEDAVGNLLRVAPFRDSLVPCRGG